MSARVFQVMPKGISHLNVNRKVEPEKTIMGRNINRSKALQDMPVRTAPINVQKGRILKSSDKSLALTVVGKTNLSTQKMSMRESSVEYNRQKEIYERLKAEEFQFAETPVNIQFTQRV